MSNASNAKAPIAVGGWLLLLCVGLVIVAPAGSLLGFLRSFEGSRSLFTDVPELKTLVGIDGILSFGILVFSICAGLALWRRRPGAVQTLKLFLVVALTYSVIALLLPFLLPPQKRDNAVLLAVGLKQFVPGVVGMLIWYLYLGRSKRVRATYADCGAGLQPRVAVRLAGIRQYSKVFDKPAGPGGWYPVLSYFVASVFGFFLYPLTYSIRGATVSRPLPFFALAMGRLLAATVVLFLLLQGLRKAWQLVIGWGVASVFIEIGYLAARRSIHMEGVPVVGVFDLGLLINAFVDAVLFAAGLTLAIRHLGVRSWSLVSGVGVGAFLAGLASGGYGAVVERAGFDAVVLIVYLVDGMMIGAMIYAGIHLRWQRLVLEEEQRAG